jgi:hypothetical protein
MLLTIEITEKKLEMLEKETNIQLTDLSGEPDEDAISYAIDVLIEQNEVD